MCRTRNLALLITALLLAGCASGAAESEPDRATTNASPSRTSDISPEREAELEEKFCEAFLAYLAESGGEEPPEDCERVVLRPSEQLDEGDAEGYLVTVVLGADRETFDLGAVVTPDDRVELRSLQSNFEHAAVQEAELTLRNLQNLIDTFYLKSEPQRLPESLDELEEEPHELAEEIPLDPWGNAYIYEPKDDGDYRLYSAGPDGRPGTLDDVVMRK